MNQGKLRLELYSGLMDVINKLGSPTETGKRLLLPSSFIGGDRHMTQLYQDSMFIVRVYGKPDLIITFTCNPAWPEILAELLPGQKPSDRPDLIARIFKQKLDELFKDLFERHVLGRCIARIWVIEFQKRGLPHCHILMILDERDKPMTIEQINRIVSAEIPDPIKFPKVHETVTSSLLHGPCGPTHLGAPCMDGDQCKKKFPKRFSEVTKENKNGYPIYQRCDNGVTVTKNGNVFDNSRVVPYNPYLTAKFNAHINVEVCSSVSAVKYLYKYVYKGSYFIYSINNLFF